MWLTFHIDSTSISASKNRQRRKSTDFLGKHDSLRSPSTLVVHLSTQWTLFVWDKRQFLCILRTCAVAPFCLIYSSHRALQAKIYSKVWCSQPFNISLVPPTRQDYNASKKSLLEILRRKPQWKKSDKDLRINNFSGQSVTILREDGLNKSQQVRRSRWVITRNAVVLHDRKMKCTISKMWKYTRQRRI